MEMLPELTALLAREAPAYEKGRSISLLREQFVRRDLPADLDRGAVSDVITATVALAEEGLQKRGRHEEKFLRPLYKRAKNLLSPGREMSEGLENGKTLAYYIEDFARLD